MVSITAEQLRFLQSVHDGLASGRFVELAPMKYRSLQLTGSEKRLEALARTELFRPGRLDLELLGCFDETLPLAWESVSDRPNLIVFENAGPFAVARMVLQQLQDPPYGMVGFGGGRCFPASIKHLASIERPVKTIDYVGDIDPEGLMIPKEANQVALAMGLPPVRPATNLHQAMFRSAAYFNFGTGWPSQKQFIPAKHAYLVDFLDEELRRPATGVLSQGNRIPEEVLGPSEMRYAWAPER